MKEFFVYLIIPERRLIILKNKIDDFNYIELMNNNGNDESYLLTICKSFCIGYIFGSKNRSRVVNDLREFQ